jgi:D-alanyl-D-alanine carboxypeptidase
MLNPRILAVATLAFVGLFGLNNAHAQLESRRSFVWSSSAQHDASEFAMPHFPTSGAERILSIDSSLRTRIINGLNAVYALANEEGRHGVAGSVIIPRFGQIGFAIGMDDETNEMSDSLAFEIASNTKTFVSALIFKLQEQGKLSIKDSIHTWLPSFPNIDSNITIKQLLEHSSGIFDYLNDDSTNAVIEQAYGIDPLHVWTPEEILNEHVGHPNFKAGKSYKYSNTNFLMLGMIAAKASGMSAAQAMHHYLLDSLGLSSICPAWEDSLMEPVAHNWFPGSDYPSTDFYVIPKTAQLTSANTAGGIIAPPAQLARWSYLLYTGQVLTPLSMAQMLRFHTWPDGTVYGEGVMRVPYYNHTFTGHSGHLLGFSSNMMTNQADSVTMVLYTNYDALPGDKSLNDYAIALLDQIYQPTGSAPSAANSRDIRVSVWPNPASRLLFVSGAPAGYTSVSLYDALGREVASASGASSDLRSELKLDVAELPAGTYHYLVIDANSRRSTGSIVVRH